MSFRCLSGLIAAAATVTVLTACGSSGSNGSGSSGSPTGRSAGGSSTAPASSATIPVLAGENFWGNITEQIGGSHVMVTSIITDPNTDPHEYETDPNDAAAVANAKLVIENGVGYDDFLDKELSAAGGDKQVLNIAKLVGVGADNPNPHLWYSPMFVKQAAQAIEKQLATDDPVDQQTFQTNLQTFLTAYQPYQDTIDRIKGKYDGEPISYTERVPGYLVQAAGLHLGTPAAFSQAVEDGTDPTPGDTAAFNADLKGRKVKALLYNSQVVDDQSTQIKQTAKDAGLPIVGVSETIPKQYPTFQAWQIAQAKELLAALGG